MGDWLCQEGLHAGVFRRDENVPPPPSGYYGLWLYRHHERETAQSSPFPPTGAPMDGEGISKM